MPLALESFCRLCGIDARPVGVCDAPDPGAFAPLVGIRRCIFDH